jgi:hypothetical protein
MGIYTYIIWAGENISLRATREMDKGGENKISQ